MPVGASITYGTQSTDGNGYRLSLRNRVEASGNKVNMVGSVKQGSMTDNDVEGWPGFIIDDVHSKATASAPKLKPNVYLVNVGTNDCVKNVDISNAANRLSSMISDLFKASPQATVILSTLLVNNNTKTEANVLNVNDQYRKLAADLRAQKQRVVLADMHTVSGPTVSQLVDGTHPNDVGYSEMAAIWYAALVEASDAGFLQKADSITGLPDDGP
jgi:lysophospholipase L1-like esterase